MSTSSYFRSRATRPRGKGHAHALDKTPLTPSDTDPSYAPSEDSEGTGASAGAGAEAVGFVDSFPDFMWMTTEEPHRSRRMAILRAHPEVRVVCCVFRVEVSRICLSQPATCSLVPCGPHSRSSQVRKLMGPTPLTFPIVLLVLSTQLALAYWLRSTHPLSPLFLLTAYTLGGTLNQNTFLAIHEITHNLAFRSIRANKLLAIVANFAIGVPYAMAFKGYHIEHHKFLGEDGIDTDLPSRIEAIVLNNVAGKTFFA
jgi:sphingolipid delta-4 desaturase